MGESCFRFSVSSFSVFFCLACLVRSCTDCSKRFCGVIPCCISSVVAGVHVSVGCVHGLQFGFRSLSVFSWSLRFDHTFTTYYYHNETLTFMDVDAIVCGSLVILYVSVLRLSVNILRSQKQGATDM